jgi:RNA recognition motif-containing protein
MPVNIRDGAILTEARGVFIQNLSYKVGSEELKALLQTAGRPLDCKIHRDRTGVSKGVATAKFASSHEAQFAVSHLNKKSYGGMILKVRLDQDTTVVGQVGPPLVVNGSGATTYR